MNLLFIGKRLYTNRDALNERFGRIYQLPKHWAESGLSTTLWLLDYHTPKRENRMDGQLSIICTPIRHPSWIATLIKQIFKAFRSDRPTIIVASGDCYIGMMAWLLARILGAKFVFDVYDKYDEFAGYYRPLGWDLFGFLLRCSDRCWFASQRLLGQIGNIQRGDRVVPNGIDAQHFKPCDLSKARQRYGLDTEGMLVGYFGSMDSDRGVEDLLGAIGILRVRGTPVELILAGHATANLNLNHPGVRYLGNLPHEDIPWVLAAVDVVAVPYRRTALLDAAASVKFGEIMACMRPLVATYSPNLVENFPAQAAQIQQYLVEPGDPVALSRAIAKQIQHKLTVEMPTGLGWHSIAADAKDDLALISQAS